MRRCRHIGEPARQPSNLPMSGMWKGATAEPVSAAKGEHGHVRPNATAPHLDAAPLDRLDRVHGRRFRNKNHLLTFTMHTLGLCTPFAHWRTGYLAASGTL